ncbi:hypothetical protein [Actinomadura sp. HBU206391]|uniref:hypothetical protein n=1 Tax=Actinomadura sp. HBU206391 TaxID=2731692 RepID=UPI001650D37A|nr:hypothetical protein [Actinomadura sp. HBU206391]MBC6457809.1 hypothetical protein [Actinomadura sp. HBU206391]
MIQPPAPVFVDATGRRRRLTRRVGVISAGLLAGYLALVGVGLFAGADLPMTPWPGNGGGKNGIGAEPGHQRKSKTPSPDAHSGTAPAPTSPGVSPPSLTAPRQTATPGTGPTATTSAPGKAGAHATPRAVGRTKSANPRKPG